MAEETEFAIGARANCSDGFCGELSRIIVDPDARSVTHLVIEPKHRHELGRLVPLDLVAGTTAGEIRLRCTLAEFADLDPAEENELVDDPEYASGYGSSAAVHGYGDVGAMGVGGSVSGMGVSMGIPHRQRTFVEEVVPEGETQIRHGEHVHAADGEIGRVQGFLVDPRDQHVTHVLLQEGHLWGRKEIAIPISAVTEIDDGVRLNITKKQVEELPPAH
jgi:sporulation protein YlmC with PRC-barrel domain